MVFSKKAVLFRALIKVVVSSALIFSSYFLFSYVERNAPKNFLARHSLPNSLKKRFKSFLKNNQLDASFFKSSEKIIEQRLTDLGFERTTSGSNSLVMRCPKKLGSFVVKAPGRFHDVTRSVVDMPLENVTRAVGADRVSDYVAQKKLQHVKAVDEYLLRIPGASKELSDYHYLVIEPLLDLDTKKSFSDFSFEQFKEMVDVICAIDYSDTSADNIVIDKQGQVYFLDTSERDYLTKYQNLPSELYFSCSHSQGDGVAQATSTSSYEENVAQALCQSKDCAKRQAGQRVNKRLDVIFHGLMPLDKEKIDAQKQAYLQEKLNHVVVDIEKIIKPFSSDQELQALDKNVEPLLNLAQLKGFMQPFAQVPLAH